MQTDLYLAAVYIKVMRISTAEITATWLLPEMAPRVAAMLNYFLDHLAGVVIQTGCVAIQGDPEVQRGAGLCSRLPARHRDPGGCGRRHASPGHDGRDDCAAMTPGGCCGQAARRSCEGAVLRGAGKEKRKNLRVRDPEKYKWKPQELLAQLAHIYLHLARADVSSLFVAAIAADERSYHEGLFSDAADVSGGACCRPTAVQEARLVSHPPPCTAPAKSCPPRDAAWCCE